MTVHAYMPRAIRQALAAGVKCIEHGHLIDEPTAKLLADKGIWWSLQPLTYDEGVFSRMSPVSQKKALAVWAGTENAYKLAKNTRLKRPGVQISSLMLGQPADRELISLRW